MATITTPSSATTALVGIPAVFAARCSLKNLMSPIRGRKRAVRRRTVHLAPAQSVTVCG